MGNSNKHNLPVLYDFTETKREYQFGKIAFIKSLELVDKNTAVYSFMEPIKLKIRITSTKNIEDVQIIARIKAENNIDKIAACLSDTFDLSSDKENEILFSIETESLLYDDYCLTVEVIKSVTTGGDYYSYDNPMTPIPLSILSDFSKDFAWSKKYWGNVILRQSRVQSL